MKMKAEREQGIVILLVAIVLLFVVGAMAALSIDVVTFYTARSEAQLAADSAALAGARVLANSGMTSDPNAGSDGLMTSSEALATTIANELAMRNEVGGRTLFPANGEVTVSFNDTDPSFVTNPRITVQTQRTDLPTFFARIWGRATVTVRASATAEAYNPSGFNGLSLGVPVYPVATTCVKPWVLPNMSPNDPSGATPIVNRTTGAIVDTNLLDRDLTTTTPALLQPLCLGGNCLISTLGPPQPWRFYPGAQSSFPAPTGVPSCSGGNNDYQNSIVGCVQTPIACNSLVSNPIDLESTHGNLGNETYNAVNCLTNTSKDPNAGDRIDPASGPHLNLPFQFLTGADNRLVEAGAISPNIDVMVSNSIVTVPIYDNGNLTNSPGTSVPIVGFVQLFLNADGDAAPKTVGGTTGILTRIINIAGCGTGATGNPGVLGNGASPVAVRLISP
jgi:hypothetical protein